MTSIWRDGVRAGFLGPREEPRRRGRANFLASDYARRAFRLSLIADVAGAWLSWLELDERAALAAETA
jgi:outer membrane protein TolC